jgi:hypothetical protein
MRGENAARLLFKFELKAGGQAVEKSADGGSCVSLKLTIPSLPISADLNGRTFPQMDCDTTRLQRTVCDIAGKEIRLRASQ